MTTLRSTRVAGIHRVPGDKSITHRALLFASLARGRSVITGALTSDDARSTAAVARAMGVTVSDLDASEVTVDGRPWRAPTTTLDCGNSGTTARLALGLLAAHDFAATLTGDDSLRRRPMRRVTDPLAAMGARFAPADAACLPITVTGGALRALQWRLTVASAQVKSALLLAAAVAGVDLVLEQIAVTRDHTERLLAGLGFEVVTSGLELRLAPGRGRFTPFAFDVPGDPSSAIFLAAAAALAGEGEIAIADVGLNPTRIAYVDVLARMGVPIRTADVRDVMGEPRGTLVVAASVLQAIDLAADVTPGVIDEIPMLACLAARAAGESRFRGLAELRVKESDRLAVLASNLRAIGTEVRIEGDDLVVQGSDAPLRGRITTHGDHRIAMAFAVLGTVAGNDIVVDDPGCASVSFPRFAETLAAVFV